MQNQEIRKEISKKEEIEELREELTPSQFRVINHLYDDILFEDGLGERFVDDYEYKRFEILIDDWEGRRFVYVYTVVGRKNDEGTMAALLTRDTRHLTIGKRGGVKLLNAKDLKTGGRRDTPIKGYRKSIIRSTV